MYIINEFLKQINNRSIFCDLDGVLVNWQKGFYDVYKMNFADFENKYGSSKAWTEINKLGVKWWANLSWLKDGKQLWKYIEQFNPIILTAPSTNPASIAGKKIWIKRELGIDIPYIIDKEKWKHINNDGDILIDDMAHNIYPWNKKGGIGILHKNTNLTIAKLENILNN
jgi:hypothetical protein